MAKNFSDVTRFRKWRIIYNPKPIADRRHDFDVVHDDYDGALDALDARGWSTSSINDAIKEIKEYEEDNP